METAQVDQDEGRQKRLTDLSVSLNSKLEEAKKARTASGIEEVWLQCEEAYLGIDDANRHTWSKAKWAKPMSMEGPVAAEDSRGDPNRSSAYVRLTARYVDCGAAKLQEILLPSDERMFSLTDTPVAGPTGLAPVAAAVVSAMPPGAMPPGAMPPGAMPPGAMPPGAMPPGAMPPGAMPPGAMPPGAMPPPQQETERPVHKAEKRITDWLIESKYPREARKTIHDAARLGTGIIKAPFAEVRRKRAVSTENGQIRVAAESKTVPGARWIDPWNLFPDGACGEDINNGDHVFERDFLARRGLEKLKQLTSAGYLVGQIDKALAAGPEKATVENSNPNKSQSEKSFEIYYYYGMLSRDDLLACEAVGADSLPESTEHVFAIATLVNGILIRASINPVDSGAFPYHVINWQRRAGHWAGIGVSEQVRTPQLMVVAATRGLLNNAGRSAGGQIIIDNNAITPADKRWDNITNEKIWYKVGDALVDDVRKAFTIVQFPNVTPHMMAIIEYAFRLAEESTNIPLISQGQSGATTPETLGATQLQNNNANQLLRSVGAAWDDCITEPVVDGFYEWLLLDPSVPADEKGDFQINVHGSELVERSIQQGEIAQILGMAANPAFEIDPAKASDELLRSWRFDPRTFKMDEAKKQALASRPPPEAPQVTVAKIRAQSDERRAKLDTDRDTAYVQAQGRRDEIMATTRIEELRLKREIAYLEAQIKKGIELDANKVKLADTAAKLRVQKELAFMGHAHQQMMKPPTEPPGRAQPGRAFEQ